MRPDKKLVKVISTIITGTGFGGRGHMKTTEARGIMHLKRGVTMIDFIKAFMAERGIETYSINQREGDTWFTSPIMSLAGDNKTVLTFHFVSFLSADLGYHAKDLRTEELDRDMKHLKKVLYG